MRGDIVVCKDFRGEFLEMVLWEDAGRTVFVHTKDQFSAHSAGSPHLEPVGFPIEDVFVCKTGKESGKVGKGDLGPYCPVTATIE